MKRLLIFAILAIAAAVAQAQIALTGTLTVDPDWVHSKTSAASTVLEYVSPILVQTNITGTNGTVAAPQMNSLFRRAVALTNGQSQTINVGSGLTNSFGDALTNLWRVNFLAVKAAASNAGAIAIGNAASDQFAGWLGGTNDTVKVRPGGLFLLTAPDATGIVSTGKLLKVANETVEPDALFTSAYLTIDAVASRFQTTNATSYAVGGAFYSKAATTNLPFSAADTINVGTNAAPMWGIWRVQVNAAGDVSTVSPATNQIYTNATLAIAALPAVSADNISLGYILVASPSNTAFTANTTALTGIGTFSNSPTTSPNVANYDIYIGGAQ